MLADEVSHMIDRSTCCRDLHVHGFPGPGSKDINSNFLSFIDDLSSLFLIMPGTFATPAIAMDQAPTIPKQIDYPSFPAEIRNKIMDFTLRPGHIYPQRTRSGVQILAASRQHRNDGHLTYYSDNIFHMPLGDNYQEILEKYRPEHRELVRRVTLTWSILDVNEKIKSLPMICKRRSLDSGNTQEAGMVRWLRDLWDDKFKAISHLFPNREEIRVEFPRFKPSAEVLRPRGLQHATEAQYWPASLRARPC